MSTAPLTTPGKLLQNLLGSWKKEFPKRASGGWWALSGFALQTSVYLLRFFEQVEKGVEPGLLAEMEHLSDIINPADGRLTLIQVKRTLTRHALTSAVEEAYLITDLCRRETPSLLNHLRFQIACQKRVTTLEVADLSMSEVINSGGDVASWDAMLKRFDSVAPITEEPDSLDQLYSVLWNAGIRNTHALIERCVGRLLISFGDPTALRQVGRELADYFFAAERHDKWEPVGSLLTAKDIMPDPMASESSEVLTGQQPRLEHLMKGFFRDRPHIFQALWETFTRWVSSLDSSERAVDDRVPVFWVSGRSGEGKSVLLIQLVAEALRSGIVSPLLQLKAGDDLPRLVASAPDLGRLTDRGFGRIFAVVDDVYDLHRHERDEWDSIILNECDYRPPPVAIITCGPTEQKEQFTARLSGPFQVTSFEVPTLSVEECRAFITWYESRTGQARKWDELTTENPLLVQLMFELAHGERISEFARRFKKRLLDMKVFDAARAILAVNALYMDAPLSLVTTDEGRDALEYLCQNEQLHFRVTLAGDEMGNAGVRLAHAHLAWLLFVEWVEPSPTTLAKAWARQLFKSLTIFEEMPTGLAASNLIGQLLHTTRLSEDGTTRSKPPVANRLDLTRELYRLHTGWHDGTPSLGTLPRWLDLEYKIPTLLLSPDPTISALSYFADSALAPATHGSVATWVWLLSETRPLPEAERMRTAVRDFFFKYPATAGVAFAVATLSGKRRNDQSVKQLVIDWLTANPVNPEAYHLIAPMVAAPDDEEVRCLTFRWLAANKSHPQAYHVIAPMVAANPDDEEVRSLAFSWVAANESHPQAYHVIAPMVAANPDEEVRSLAVSWLVANESHPQTYWLIAVLVAANPDDEEVRSLAFSWLAANGSHPQAYQVIAPMVAANPDDEEIRSLAVSWLAANESHPQAYQVIAPMVAGNPDDEEVRSLAVSWLVANKLHPQTYWLIAPLVAANPDDKEVRSLAVSWLAANESHPQTYSLIAPLVAANPTDIDVISLATDWLKANEAHPQYHELLRVMIARSDGSKEWLDRGAHYVQKADSVHPETIFAVLITAGKAEPKFIEMAFDFLENTTATILRSSILYHLSRALVRNFDNAVQYLLGSHNEQRKKTVCASIALGMKRFPDTIAAFALDVIPRIDADHVYHILRNVITRGLENDYLDEMIVQWLVDNDRRRGYGGMLDALHKNPAFWERLLMLGELPKRIVSDLKTRNS